MAFFASSLLRGAVASNLAKAPKAGLSFQSVKESKFGKALLGTLAVGGGVALLATPVLASDMGLHSPNLPWSHNGVIASFDHGAIRRGYQVYKEVCAACHSMQYMAYRQLVDHVLTEEEAKADAAEQLVEDGPDDKGKMFMRPGRITDRLPSPYPNTEAARAANNGALPPDLTFVSKARHGNENYIFHLLTGYHDPPAGKHVSEGQYYNPYFPGGGISMARALYDELLEYPDGTPASTGQMAKDVATFLAWTSDRNHDQRKLVFFKACIVLTVATIITGIYKRKRWTTLKSRKLVYKNRPPPRTL